MTRGSRGGVGHGPDADVPPEELGQALDALFSVMRRVRSAGAERLGGISLAQLDLLVPLLSEPELPVGRLATGAGVSVPTATRALQHLEVDGVVIRRRSTEDERRVIVSLTDEGARQLTALRDHKLRRQAVAYATFSAAERVQLLSLVRRLTALVAATD